MVDSESRIGRRELLGSIGAVGASGLAGCTGGDGDSGNGGDDGDDTETSTEEPTATDAETDTQETVEVGFAYLTQPGDHGWTYQHDQAVQAVDEQFDWVEISKTDSVSNEDVGSVMEQYADDGQDIVFGTSFGYMDAMYEVSEQYPDTLFEHCAGFRTNDNLSRYFVHMDQTYFLAGIAAGMMTETDRIGYLAPFPIAEVIRFVNAFTIGARLHNESVETDIRWMNSWYDPSGATQAAQSLVDVDCDVISGAMDSPAMVEAAADEGAYAIGANSQMAEWGGDYYITSAMYNWVPYYEETLKSVRDGTWESGFHWGHIRDGGVELDDWGPEVPDDVKDAVETERQALIDGDRTIWEGTKFEGESDDFLFEEMESFVPGVDGEIP